MPKKILNIVDVAYRATLEEQDDPVLWISNVLKGNGADLDVLLRGAAVNYAVKTQDSSGLAFGTRRQTQPPRLADDVAGLVKKGLKVQYVEDDARERGLHSSELVEGLTPVARAQVPALLGNYDQVWKW
jgi:hypothetical protein